MIVFTTIGHQFAFGLLSDDFWNSDFIGCEYRAPFKIIEIVFIIPKGNETRGSVAVITSVGVVQGDVVTIDGVGDSGHVGVRSEHKLIAILILLD